MATLVVYNVTLFCYTVKKRSLDKEGEQSDSNNLYDEVTHLLTRQQADSRQMAGEEVIDINSYTTQLIG